MGEEVKTLANFYLPPMVYLDFYRHFTLKNHRANIFHPHFFFPSEDEIYQFS